MSITFKIKNQNDLMAFLKARFKGEIITSEDIINLGPEIEKVLDNDKFDSDMFIESLDELFDKQIEKAKLFQLMQEKFLLEKAFGVKNITATKLDSIKRQLKEMKQVAKKYNDSESIEDLDWIINAIQEGNLYEMDLGILSNEQISNKENKEGIDYMIEYSKMGNQLQKSKDLQIIRNNSKKKTVDPKRFNKSCLRKETFEEDDENEKSIEMSPKKSPIQLKESESPRKRNNSNNSKKRVSAYLKSYSFTPELTTKLLTLMSRIDYPDFEIFTLDSLTNTKGSIITAKEIMDRLDIVKSDNIDSNVLSNFLLAVIAGYSRENAYYHNDLHAADVMQTLFTMFVRGNLPNKMKLDDISRFSVLIGAVCHDLKHTGQNNMFHINSRSKIALRYNDISVLENYHIANIFKLTKDDKLNIFKLFKPEEYRIMRRRIVGEILATDMACHQKVLGEMKSKMEKFGIKQGKNFNKLFLENDATKLFDIQQVVINMCVHTADISNPAKPPKISAQWTDRVYEEFFRQGDLEKKMGMSVSLMCDRLTTNVNKAMIGFINFVVMPTIDMLFHIVPEVPEYSRNIRENLKKHESEYEKDKASEMFKKQKSDVIEDKI